MIRKRLKYGAAGLLLVAGAIASDAVNLQAATAEGPGRAMTRRLTSDQYANVVAEVFGPSIEMSGRFEPDARVDGLVEVGAGRVSVSVDGMAQYDSMAMKSFFRNGARFLWKATTCSTTSSRAPVRVATTIPTCCSTPGASAARRMVSPIWQMANL